MEGCSAILLLLPFAFTVKLSLLSKQLVFSDLIHTGKGEKRKTCVCVPSWEAASSVNADLKVDTGTPCYADETGRQLGGTRHLPFLQVSSPSSWLRASSLFLRSIPRSEEGLETRVRIP